MNTATLERPVTERAGSGDPFAGLRAKRYLRLATYRRSGVPVATPVWFVEENGRLYCRSDATSGKAKRVRRTPRVRVAACTAWGAPRGADVAALARLLPPEHHTRVQALLLRKYGWQMRLFDRLRGHGDLVYVELTFEP